MIILRELSGCTFLTVLNCNANEISTVRLTHNNIYYRIKEFFIKRGVCVWKFPNWAYQLTPDYYSLQKLLQEGREKVFNMLVVPRVQEVEDRRQKGLEPYITHDGSMNFITRAIQLYNDGVFSKDDLIHEIETIMITVNNLKQCLSQSSMLSNHF